MFGFDANFLLRAFETEDEVGSVLRTHLIIEKFLDWTFDHFVQGALKTCIQRPSNFKGKLSIAAALGLPVEIAVAINQLNNVRNDLAHRMENINGAQVEQYGRVVDALTNVYSDGGLLMDQTVEFRNKNPGVVHRYGAGDVRMDFVIASLALVKVAVYWSGSFDDDSAAA